MSDEEDISDEITKVGEAMKDAIDSLANSTEEAAKNFPDITEEMKVANETGEDKTITLDGKSYGGGGKWETQTLNTIVDFSVAYLSTHSENILAIEEPDGTIIVYVEKEVASENKLSKLTDLSKALAHQLNGRNIDVNEVLVEPHEGVKVVNKEKDDLIEVGKACKNCDDAFRTEEGVEGDEGEWYCSIKCLNEYYE